MKLLIVRTTHIQRFCGLTCSTSSPKSLACRTSLEDSTSLPYFARLRVASKHVDWQNGSLPMTAEVSMIESTAKSEELLRSSNSSLTLRRSVGEAGEDPMEESDALRSLSCFGPSGITGTVVSP